MCICDGGVFSVSSVIFLFQISFHKDFIDKITEFRDVDIDTLKGKEDWELSEHSLGLETVEKTTLKMVQKNLPGIGSKQPIPHATSPAK